MQELMFTEDGLLVINGVVYKEVGTVTDETKLASDKKLAELTARLKTLSEQTITEQDLVEARGIIDKHRTAKDIAESIIAMCKGTGSKVTENGLEVKTTITDLSGLLLTPEQNKTEDKGHYYKGEMLRDIKHGLAFQGDSLPHWWEEVHSAIDNEYTSGPIIRKTIPSADGTNPYFHHVTSMEMDGEHVRLTTDTGCTLLVLPCQIKYTYDDDNINIELIILEMSDVVRDLSHSIPAIFAYMHEHIAEMDFHPVKSPKTIKLLHDITLHLLRPMTVDAPNENMQQAVKEILWHMNNHIKEGDYFVLSREGSAKPEKGIVKEFNKDTGKVLFDNETLGILDNFYITDTNVCIEKYFGIERWAYKSKMVAMLACNDFLRKLTAERTKAPEAVTDVQTESHTV